MKTILLAISLLLGTQVIAADPPGKGPSRLEEISKMRNRQEGEENVYRIIQQPIVMTQTSTCTPAEQARQRIRDIGESEDFNGNVSVTAGHGDVSIEGNSGEINNSVNINVVNPNERKCF